MEWAEETIVRPRSLWDEGHSTADIGRLLGISKNAVVGKAHRLDLPERPSPIKRSRDSNGQFLIDNEPKPPRRGSGPTFLPWAGAAPAVVTLREPRPNIPPPPSDPEPPASPPVIAR